MKRRIRLTKPGPFLTLAVLLLFLFAGRPGRPANAVAPSAPSGGRPAALQPLQPQAVSTTGIVFRVTIERVTATQNFDGDPFFDKADFFGRVRIDTATQRP